MIILLKDIHISDSKLNYFLTISGVIANLGTYVIPLTINGNYFSQQTHFKILIKSSFVWDVGGNITWTWHNSRVFLSPQHIILLKFVFVILWIQNNKKSKYSNTLRESYIIFLYFVFLISTSMISSFRCFDSFQIFVDAQHGYFHIVFWIRKCLLTPPIVTPWVFFENHFLFYLMSQIICSYITC